MEIFLFNSSISFWVGSSFKTPQLIISTGQSGNPVSSYPSTVSNMSNSS